MNHILLFLQTSFVKSLTTPVITSILKQSCFVNSVGIGIPNFLKFGFHMVWYLNGWSMGYVLCSILTIQVPDQYIRKQDGVHASSIQMVRQSGIQMAFKYRTIRNPTSFSTI